MELLVALLGGGTVGAAFEFVRWYIRRKDAKLANSFESRLESYDHVFQLLQQIIEQTSASRALLIKTHNCNGVPRPGGEIKVTVLQERQTDGLKPCRESFQGWAPDKDYVDMLIRLMREESLELHREQMHTGDLKDTYAEMGVSESLVKLLHVTSTGMYYISVSKGPESYRLSLDPSEDQVELPAGAIFDARERAVIRGCALQISKLVRMYEPGKILKEVLGG